MSYRNQACTLEFDGACSGNPGPAGAGAILRPEIGSRVFRYREGLGNQTSNGAEYRALILGLRQAIRKGFTRISVQGDSLVVCNQLLGLWRTNDPNLKNLCDEALQLKTYFHSFYIKHIPREYNIEAHAQAHRAINLRDGQVEEDCGY
ncbi:uncharacterized protein [Cicer arietinum]|uniref:Uncharacterized protein LOC101504552 n=1 Tax=Cicer arietinum TaxID=3827 RepID=A0A1S2XG51_CICAR|nr:uncharacterized protein LOC101504552 [Cicer arietinum]